MTSFSTRRRLLATGLGALASPAFAGGGIAQAQPPGQGFERFVLQQARRLAARPWTAPADDLPDALGRLSYDGYRDLGFDPARAVWADQGLPFRLQMFHRGGLFRHRVALFEVAGGAARPILYRPEQFRVGPRTPAGRDPGLGFAGFRIHGPINRPGVFDEIAAFLGASYFRAVPRGGLYGLSARGLAVGAGEPDEEFPAFRAFWIERPAPGADRLVVHALLDGPSVSGAWRFVVVPGDETTMEVEAELFPRRPLSNLGVAPVTSMFLFGPEQPRRFDDFRPEVHDSDGLMIANARGERLWRPLSNPRRVETSAFLDTGPRGFGLMQRARDWDAYRDDEALYHRRPNLWVEPLAGFGAGDVRLVELPARHEGEDNVVASWRPAASQAPRRGHRFAYRLRWSLAEPREDRARAAAWRTGAGSAEGRRRFVIDWEGGRLDGSGPDLTASAGRLLHPTVQATGERMRLSFELDPQGAPVSELRAALARDGRVTSEVWTYRWLASS